MKPLKILLHRCEWTDCWQKGTEIAYFELTDPQVGHGVIAIRYCPEHKKRADRWMPPTDANT